MSCLAANQCPDADVILAELQGACHEPSVVHVFEQLDSTSVWLRERLLTLQNRKTQLCVTDWQTAGIGRRGRTWQTKPGNITFSMLSFTATAPKDLLGLSLVTGIGVADCLQENCGIDIQLKWPNDVLFRGAKLGGLLTEISRLPAGLQSSACTQVLTGIGVNVVHDDAITDLGIGATSLQAASESFNRESRDRLIGKLAASVLSAHQQFYQSGWAAFAERWQALDWLRDREVTIVGEQSTEHAVARGVNEQGALMVERAGTVYPLYGGNVSIRPTR